MPSLSKWVAALSTSIALALGGWTYAQGERVASLETRVETQAAALAVMLANTQADVREIRADIRAIRDSLVAEK